MPVISSRHPLLHASFGEFSGNDVIMGPGVKIFSENHNVDDLETPIRLQGESRRGVVIGNDCWIGSGVSIVDGVTIERGSIIAAGSVVINDVPQFSVYGGIPAKLIRKRGEQTRKKQSSDELEITDD